MSAVDGFVLRNVPKLSRKGFDRAEDLRTDPDATRSGWSRALLLRVDAHNQVVVADGRAVLGSAIGLSEEQAEDAVLLGRMPDGRHVWAVRAPLERPADPHAESAVLDLRSAGGLVDEVSAQMMATAAALLNWHDNARFSAIDGSPTSAYDSGWQRINPVTRRREFPRLDPAVICLIHDGHDRAVLARHAAWPAQYFSLLAGFVEAGESFESCVEREVAEEIGLSVRDVTYVGSQPWPFPCSLMAGFHAIGDPQQQFRFSDGEIVEAEWLTRAEVRALLAEGDWSSHSPSRILLPGSISIARDIIEAWASTD